MRRTRRRPQRAHRMFCALTRFFSCTGYKNGRRKVQHRQVQHRNALPLMRKTLPSKRQPLYDAQLAIFQEVCVLAVRKQAISSAFAIVVVVTFALGAYAQQKEKDREQKDRAATSSNTTIDPKLYGAMKWRLIGPFRGGRVLAVTGVTSQPNTYYMGAVSGGVWKTTDGGVSWDPLFDKQSVSSIGAIAVSESDPNVIYAGTGEACIRGNISFGNGVYRSNDAGKTGTNIGLKDSRHIGKV